MEIEKDGEKKEENGNPVPAENKNDEATPNEEPSKSTPPVETIIDLAKLAGQPEINNSDILLAIFEICTFNKKYNYECSNNTKAFWERVVEEGVLKKIFKNFKSETLRKYWKLIRQTGNNDKFMEIVRQNEKFINNPVFKLLPIINGISQFMQSNLDIKTFEEFFTGLNAKDKKPSQHKDDNEGEGRSPSPRPKLLKVNKKIIEDESEKEEVDPKILKMDEVINQLMKLTKYSREEVFKALFGTSGNIKNAYLYLMNSAKYEKFFFYDTDDYIIKNLTKKEYFQQVLDAKGEELIKEREKFLGIKPK